MSGYHIHSNEAGHDVSEWLLSLPDLGPVMHKPLTSTSNEAKHEKLLTLLINKWFKGMC